LTPPLRAALFAGVALVLGTMPLPAAAQDPLEPVRRSYRAAVDDEAAIARGLAAIAALRAGDLPAPERTAPLLDAYEGALITLRARHGTWPPARLRHLRTGLGILDRAVAAHSAQPEIRFLRLMSGYYLPGILGRTAHVAEDFEALARLLPGARAGYPAEMHAAMTRFVLDHGRPSPEQRRDLERSIAPPPR
jgi:hypothetical protein